jgi:hypothetical protein
LSGEDRQDHAKRNLSEKAVGRRKVGRLARHLGFDGSANRLKILAQASPVQIVKLRLLANPGECQADP